MRKLLLLLAMLCFLDAFSQVDSTWQIKPLSINTSSDEYLFFWENGMGIFTSTRPDPRNIDKAQGTPERIYIVENPDTSFGKIKRYPFGFTDANIALISVSKESFLFYRCDPGDEGEIYEAKKKQERDVKQLKRIKNISSEYDENSATIFGDSIIFTSNREGNYQIYFQKRNGVEKPIPLDALNSPFDEVSVGFSSSGKELYFSSNREGNQFDIYMTTLVDGKWQAPIKFPYPFNDPTADDTDFSLHDSVAYIASNRSGGLGGYDIYRLTKPVFIPSLDSLRQDSIPPLDSIPKLDSTRLDSVPKLDSIPVRDSLPPINRNIVPLTPRQQLITKLKELGLDTLNAEIQIFASKRKSTTISLLKEVFPCIANEDIRMDIVDEIDGPPMRKFIINTLYTDINKAIDKQITIVGTNCFAVDKNEKQATIPFIALLKDDQRYAIFWAKEASKTKEEFWIIKDKQEIWRSK